MDRLAIMASGKIQALGSVQALRDQMHLPLSVMVRLSPDHVASARAALAPLREVTCEVTEEGLRVNCPRQSKMLVLGALTALGSNLLDLDIKEASLEDVFFGFSD